MAFLVGIVSAVGAFLWNSLRVMVNICSFFSVLTENFVSDRVGIGESKAELERPVQRDYLA